MFDAYTLKARFYPIVILFMPVLVLGTILSIEMESLTHVAFSAGLMGALTYLFSQLGRDAGKRKEKGLWEEWGGTPSVQVLRWRDNRIDQHTKQRYHTILRQRCPVSLHPDLSIEATDPVGADEVYKSWTKFLLGRTRDESKFPLLLKENTSYGFRRNLWGIKPVAIALILLLFLGNYGYHHFISHTWEPQYLPYSFFYANAFLVAVLIFWIFVVTKRWVKLAAFAYAERLCECTEKLD